MPSKDIDKVRGIGVAVSVRMSTSERRDLELFLLANTEAVFFVDDDKAEIFKLDFIGKQFVRTDDDVDRAVFDTFDRCVHFL